jgi:cell division protein FtsB
MAAPKRLKRLRKVLRSPRLVLIAAILTVLTTTLLLSNKGLWRHAKLRHEIAKQEDILNAVTTEEARIGKHVALLQAEDPGTIERIARERYRLRRPGEIVFIQKTSAK